LIGLLKPVRNNDMPIIDKRFLPKNQTSGSRQKFIERYKNVIKQKIREIVDKGTMQDAHKGEKKIIINSDSLDTPQFELDRETGKHERVYNGNKQYHKGQEIKRSKSGKAAGRQGSNKGGGEDDFEFILSESEFANLFFEDLELPDLIKREFLNNSFEIKHAGLSRYGGPSSLNIKRTMLNALARRIALRHKKVWLDLEEAYAIGLSQRKKVQFIEEIDLKFNFKDKVDVPITKAVMFCIMDVSGSMGEKEKDLAKRFFILLNMFLRKNYQIVDLVFIRHAEIATECTEEIFFHGRMSGGTVMSSAYELSRDIIKNRYTPEQWNIYIAHASDGDNWEDDNEYLEKLLTTSILPNIQHMAYIDIQSIHEFLLMSGAESGALKIFKRLMKSNKNLQARVVKDYHEIFPVFRSLFKKKGIT